MHFSEMLVVNSSLLELHLGTMGLSDTGMERLCDGLQHNRSLRYLDLRWWVGFFTIYRIVNMVYHTVEISNVKMFVVA